MRIGLRVELESIGVSLLRSEAVIEAVRDAARSAVASPPSRCLLLGARSIRRYREGAPPAELAGMNKWDEPLPQKLA